MCEYYIVSAVTRRKWRDLANDFAMNNSRGLSKEFLSLSYNGEGGIDLSISLLGVERLTNLYNRKTIPSVSQVMDFFRVVVLVKGENTYETSRILIADVTRLL